ncbi:AAA family ATPase [Corynebacterium sp. zg254]|uniref:AAA family ATPase n=1 Tax=Corynebacterium zhongnanshanii TaxID=2768834 RepID=A0ABQ6VFK6_9CORY|nr:MULTISPECIES: AAA family ATPase [Corynebacterium]KAB3523199.1 AAA family ATPase [Corynebacterium zhongnanshanii]MCR5913689.1 AAA family ATPase [Corynebacterium sp. zg254]
MNPFVDQPEKDRTSGLHPALRVEEIQLKNVKAIDHLIVRPQATGVTVIHGDNETGKSTIIEAFHQLLAGSALTSQKVDVKALRPVSRDEQPDVQATLQIGPYHLTYRRVFAGKKSKAELRVDAPHVENVTGVEAINRFQAILSSYSDESLRSSMSVKQGDILRIEELFKHNSLSQAIGRASTTEEAAAPSVADVAMDADTQQLIDRAREVRGKYFTPKSTNTYTKAFKAHVDELAEAEQALHTARERMSEAQRHAETIQRATLSLKNLSDEKQQLTQRLQELEQLLEQAQSKERELAQAAEQVTAAHSAVDEARSVQDKRRALIEEIDSKTRALAALDVKVQEATKATDAEKRAREAQRSSLKSIRVELNVAQALRELLRARIDATRCAQRRDDVAQKVDAATSLDRQRIELKERIDELPVTSDILSEIQERAHDFTVSTARRDAAATTVHIEGPAGATVGDGDRAWPLGDDGVDITVGSRRTFTLGDYRVTVAPAGHAEDLEESVHYAHDRLVASLKKAGIHLEEPLTSGEECARLVEEVRQSATRRAALTTQLDDVMGDLRELLGSASLAQRQQELEELEAQHRHALDTVATAERMLSAEHDNYAHQAESPDLNLEELRSREFFDEQWIKDLRERIDDAERADNSAVERCEAAQSKAESEYATVRSALELRTQDLAAAREALSDDDLEARIAEASAALDTAVQNKQQVEASVDGVDSPEMLASKVNGKRQALRDVDRREREEERSIDIARHEIDSAGGTAEDVQEAEARYEHLRQSVHSAESQAEAANLLVELFDQAYEDVMVQYQAPFLDEFTSLAKRIFGTGVTFELGQDLSVTKRIMNGEGIALDQLSGGATEQIAMLYRLAAASLMGKGESVPIFLDDTLGYTDEFRTENMNAVLALMGKEHQIIVTTCDARRFSSVAGAYTISIDQAKSNQSAVAARGE